MGTVNFDELIAKIPDFPKPGVVFRDITTLLKDAEGFAAAIDNIAEHYASAGITKVIGAEARGFMIGAPVAYRMRVGFVPARKPGKLPRQTRKEEYELEYGFDTLEVHEDAINAEDTVLIVDDLVATGGTATAQARLVESFGAKLAGFAFLMELVDLDPRATIAEATEAEVYSLVKVHEPQ